MTGISEGPSLDGDVLGADVDGVESDVVEPDVLESDGERDPDLVPVPAFEPTGEPRVDDAVAPLVDLVGAPTSEHVGVFDDVHRRLQDALADLGSDP